MSVLSGEVIQIENLNILEEVPQDLGNQNDDNVVDREPVGNNEQQQAEIQECCEVTEEYGNAEQTKLSIEDFVLMKVLGQGNFGKVFLVQKIAGRDSNKHFAMKVIQKSPLFGKPKQIELTRTERNILATVKHPFIVEMAYAFQTKDKLCLVLEYMRGGDLLMLLQRQIRLSEADARFVSSEIILALGHLHGLGIIYRDLKPENVLLDAEGHVKLTDFGLSKENLLECNRTYSYCGTISYMAPEILSRNGYGKAVDWWALGAVIYEMICGRRAFSGECRLEVARNITEFNLQLLPFLKKKSLDLVRCLLRRVVWKRLGSGPDDAIAVQSHVFFKDINWDHVLARRVKSPFKSLLRDDNDISQPNEKFTYQFPVDNPTNSSDDVDFHFEGFSYEEPPTLDETRCNTEVDKSWINTIKSYF